MKRPRIHFNEDLNGIELYFDNKPEAKVLSDIKAQGFRWSNRYKKWYAKRTPEREQFVKTYFGEVKKETESQKESEKAVMEEKGSEKEQAVSKAEAIEQPVSEKNEAVSIENPVQEKTETVVEAALKEAAGVKPNVFASYFDSVGNGRIYPDAEISIVDFRNGFHAGYFAKENVMVSIKNNDETIYVQELDGAFDSKKSCKLYTMGVEGICERREDKDAIIYLHNELGIRNVSELIAAVKNPDFDFKNLGVRVREVKGNDLFSPFQEVLPLKQMPEKWTKVQLVKAICSGQIYRAECEHRYTDDYAYDAACNYNAGKELSLPYLAKDYVERWDGRTTSVRAAEVEGNTCVLRVSDSSETTRLYFDLDCDMAKGAEKRAGLEAEKNDLNEMMEQTVISFADAEIYPEKFYDVTYLEKDDNTGKYKEVNEMVQGVNLIDFDEPDKFHWWYEKMVSVTEKTIVPGLFYKVSDLYNQTICDLDDRRFIPMGNHNVLVSGQTLLEFAEEGRMVPYVSAKTHCGNTFEAVKKELQAFIDGVFYWGVDVSKVDYKDSLKRVCEEEMRLAGMVHSTRGTSKVVSLTDRISEIESRRKLDGKEKATGKQKEFERV